MAHPADRRRFLRQASLLAAGATALPRTLLAQTPATPGSPDSTAIPPNLPTLREAAAGRNLLVGTAVDLRALRRDPAYAGLIKQQANIIVAENAMKFGPLRPAPDKFFFDDADALFAFAETNGMVVRGHNFVWHRQLAPWFASYVTKDNAASVLTNHIETVAGRYAGRVHSWDVVNEAIQVADGLPGGLRNSPWYKLLGPDYLDLAYRTARKADPKALLTYNDYDVESESPAQAAKRDAVLKLVTGMKDRGVPIDAVGIQSHIKASGETYGPGLRRFMSQIQDMGLKIMLTELDVNDRALPADPATRDKAVGALYGNYLNLTLANPNLVAALTWGITDKYTWLNSEGSRPDKQPERALPFDANLRPKQAYIAEVQALQNAPARG